MKCRRMVNVVGLGLVLLCSTFISASVSADDGTENRETTFFNEPPTPEEIAKLIFPEPTYSKTRSFFDKEENLQKRSSVGMPILFHFGRTSFVESSKPFLDSVGQLMSKPEYSDEVLLIEGHTDAVGDDSNNMRLSERRATAVRDYLVSKYDINPLKLFVAGKGESALWNTSKPNSGENRRVEFLRHPLWVVE